MNMVTVETTLDEVVDLPALEVAGKGTPSCLQEALWQLELPIDFNDEHTTWKIEI
jgi:hypothetical protein